MWQYVAVALGAYAGMLWPLVIRLLRSLQPKVQTALAASPSLFPVDAKEHPVLRFLGWLLLAAIVAGVVTAFNIVPLVTGDAADKLKALGGWQYFLLASEGFGLAAIIEEPIRQN